MVILQGHGLWLKAFFANGDECKYPRPFLVLNVNNTIVTALNVSSITGKIAKLSMPSNQGLINHFPPFKSPSFVKLDELYQFEFFDELENVVLCQGKVLSQNEFSMILQKHANYTSSNPQKCYNVKISKEDILHRNSDLHI